MSRPWVLPCLDSAVRISTPTQPCRLMVWVLTLISVCSNDRIVGYVLYCFLQELQINYLYWGPLVQAVQNLGPSGNIVIILFHNVLKVTVRTSDTLWFEKNLIQLWRLQSFWMWRSVPCQKFIDIPALRHWKLILDLIFQLWRGRKGVR